MSESTGKMAALRACLFTSFVLLVTVKNSQCLAANNNDDFFFSQSVRQIRQIASDDEDLIDGSGDGELITDPPPPPPPSTTTTTTKRPVISSKSLVSIKVCGKEFYCPIGKRGPCQPNEILIESNNSTAKSNLSCSVLSTYPWTGCVASKQAGKWKLSSAMGQCVLTNPEDPCSGYPTNFRYHSLKRACHPVSLITGKWLVNSCGEDQVFVGVGDSLGYCRCRNERHLPFAENNRCYHPFTKGNCNDGYWLEQSIGQQLYCRPCPCPDLADGRHIFWNGGVYGKQSAGCYRSFTRGPCPEGNTFIIDDYIKGRGRCHTYWPFLSL